MLSGGEGCDTEGKGEVSVGGCEDSKGANDAYSDAAAK